MASAVVTPSRVWKPRTVFLGQNPRKSSFTGPCLISHSPNGDEEEEARIATNGPFSLSAHLPARSLRLHTVLATSFLGIDSLLAASRPPDDQPRDSCGLLRVLPQVTEQRLALQSHFWMHKTYLLMTTSAGEPLASIK